MPAWRFTCRRYAVRPACGRQGFINVLYGAIPAPNLSRFIGTPGHTIFAPQTCFHFWGLAPSRQNTFWHCPPALRDRRQYPNRPAGRQETLEKSVCPALRDKLYDFSILLLSGLCSFTHLSPNICVRIAMSYKVIARNSLSRKAGKQSWIVSRLPRRYAS